MLAFVSLAGHVPRMRIHLHTLGCRLNEAELARWSREFRAAGSTVVPSVHDADVVVLNTCNVTADAARTSRRLTRRFHRDNPTARIVLTGCFSTMETDTAAGLPGVDLLVENEQKDRLVPIVLESLAPGAAPAAAMEAPTFERHPTDRRRRAFIKVQDGCRNRCSFCVVTLARGAERSRSVADVVDEVRGLVAAGRHEVVLTGVHLGGYGSDLSTADSPVHLTHLMRAILEDTDVRRLRVGSLEPWDLPPDFERLWVDHPRLMPHLHLPAQSGSPTVLQRMRRRNPPDRYLALVQRLRAAHPRMQITTDLIVGFPGETDHEFAETRAFVDRIGFADAHVFVWSPRPGTRAATLPDRVDKATAKQRSATLHRQLERHRDHALSTRVGTDVEVLVERVRPGEDGALVAMGYSEEYLPVRVLGAASDWLGSVVRARVQSAEHGALWAPSGNLRVPA